MQKFSDALRWSIFTDFKVSDRIFSDFELHYGLIDMFLQKFSDALRWSQNDLRMVSDGGFSGFFKIQKRYHVVLFQDFGFELTLLVIDAFRNFVQFSVFLHDLMILDGF